MMPEAFAKQPEVAPAEKNPSIVELWAKVLGYDSNSDEARDELTLIREEAGNDQAAYEKELEQQIVAHGGGELLEAYHQQLTDVLAKVGERLSEIHRAEVPDVTLRSGIEVGPKE